MNPDDLTPQEAGILLGLVREGIRKSKRAENRGTRRWGREYNPSSTIRRMEILEGIYLKLGGDPKMLSERGDHGPSRL